MMHTALLAVASMFAINCMGAPPPVQHFEAPKPGKRGGPMAPSRERAYATPNRALRSNKHISELMVELPKPPEPLYDVQAYQKAMREAGKKRRKAKK